MGGGGERSMLYTIIYLNDSDLCFRKIMLSSCQAILLDPDNPNYGANLQTVEDRIRGPSQPTPQAEQRGNQEGSGGGAAGNNPLGGEREGMWVSECFMF